jgi:hypothetical protein
MQDAPFFLASAEHTIINAQGCGLHIKVAGDHDRVHYEALSGGVISFSRICLCGFKLHLFIADAALRQSQVTDKSQKLWH